ncbi:sulfatase [Acidobacteriota bacterium]
MKHLKACVYTRAALLFLVVAVAGQIFVSCQPPAKRDSRRIVLDLVEDFPFMEPVEQTGRIDFSSGKASPLLLEGWGGLYAGPGLWATSLSSRLRFFSFIPGSHRQVVIRCAPFVDSGSREQQMEVYLNHDNDTNDGYIARLSLEPESREYALTFPLEKIVRGENIITFRYSHLEKLDTEDPAAERKEPRAVNFEWISFPDAASSRKHIYRQEDSILIDPLARMQYHFRVPDEGRLRFQLGFPDQPQVPEGHGADPILSVFIQEEGTVSQKIFEEHMTAASASRERREVDLSSHAGLIVRLTFQLECPADPYTEMNAIYVRIGRPTVEGYGRLLRRPGATPKSPELEGIEKSNLILIILDAANPVHFGSYGYGRDTTPNMDRLARDGVLFSRAFAHAPNTQPSTASLFTSTYPPTHRVIARDTMLSDSAVSWAEELRDAGIKTFAATSNINVSPVYGLLQGFDEYAELYKTKKGGVVLAEEFLQPTAEWIEKNRTEQFFMYLHILQPHAPYAPAPPFEGTFSSGYQGRLQNVRRLSPRTIDLLDFDPEDLEYIVAKYDENLLYADSFVGDLIDLLRKSELLENTILLITSDHGEAFHDHGHVGHSSSLYDDEIRIPLILRFPLKYNLGGKKIEAVVQSIDLMPTFLDLFEIRHRGQDMQGRSLLPVLFDQSQQVHDYVASFLGRIDPDGTQVISALRGKRFKYFEHRARRFLFDVQADPLEQINIYHSEPVIAGYYVQELKMLQEEWSEGKGLAAESKIKLDKKIREQLRSLGYIK